MPVSQKRHAEIDILRTVAILCMIVFHAAFDLQYFFDFPVDTDAGNWQFLRLFTVSLFLGLSGIGSVLSARKATGQATIWMRAIRRGFLILSAAMLVSLATAIMDPATYVRFGILHLIGVAALLAPLFIRFKEWNALLGFLLLMVAILPFDRQFSTSLLLPLGFYPAGFATLDYYPLVPWLGIILVGMAVGHCLYVRPGIVEVRREVCAAIQQSRLAAVLGFPGRYSLLIYLVHQPLLIAGLSLIM